MITLQLKPHALFHLHWRISITIIVHHRRHCRHHEALCWTFNVHYFILIVPLWNIYHLYSILQIAKLRQLFDNFFRVFLGLWFWLWYPQFWGKINQLTASVSIYSVSQHQHPFPYTINATLHIGNKYSILSIYTGMVLFCFQIWLVLKQRGRSLLQNFGKWPSHIFKKKQSTAMYVVWPLKFFFVSISTCKLIEKNKLKKLTNSSRPDIGWDILFYVSIYIFFWILWIFL